MLAIVNALRASKRQTSTTDSPEANAATGILGGLYGDLELSSSIGHSQTCRPCFLEPTVLAYVSGSVVNSIDIATGRTNKPIVGKSVITAIASSPRDGVVAFAERGKLSIRVLKWPGATSTGVSVQVPHGDLSIKSMAFSPNGRYLATLGDIPSFQVCLFDWRTGTLLASTLNDGPASLLSFDPQDPSVMVTSGDRIGARFFKIEGTHKKCNLRSIKTKDVNDDPLLSLDVEFSSTKTLVSHAWTPDNNLLVPSHDGDSILLYNSRTGEQQEFVHSQGSETDTIPNQIRVVAVCVEGAVIGCEDGRIHWLGVSNSNKISKSLQVDKSPITSLVHSPDYRYMAISCGNGKIFKYDVHPEDETENLSLAVDICGSQVSQFALLAANNTILLGRDDGKLIFYEGEISTRLQDTDMDIGSCVIATAPYSPLVATASKTGVLRIFNADGVTENAKPRLLSRTRLHSGRVLTLSFDPIGRYLASMGEDGRIFLCDVFSKFEPIGYLHVSGRPVKLTWSVDEGADSDEMSLYLYVLTTDNNTKSSVVHRFQLPVDDHPLEVGGEDKMTLVKVPLDPVLYQADDEWRDFAVSWGQLTGYREVFYAMSTDRCLKVYNGRSRNNGPALDEAMQNGTPLVLLGNALAQFSNHEKTDCRLTLSPTLSWILTWSADGHVTVRSVLDLDQAIVVPVHDPSLGGVVTAQFSRDQRILYTVGRDGLIRLWEWKYTTAGRRAATETESEIEQFEEMQVEYVATVMDTLVHAPAIDDVVDSDSERAIWAGQATTDNKQSNMEAEIEEYKNSLRARATLIRERITDTIRLNETVPSNESLDKGELVIDLSRRDRLSTQTEERVSRVRAEAEEQNLKMRVIRNRLKREVWDSMEVPGESIKSFNPSKLTNNRFEVQNFAIRRRSSEELAKITRVKLMRRVQMVVNSAILKPSNRDDEDEIPKLASLDSLRADVIPEVNKYTNKELLYDPTELTTVEKRVQQIVLLSEVAMDVKTEFNGRFREFSKSKRDEITKIEEKNDRIAEIMADLQLNEAIPHPTLDDYEVPERVIEVRPDEIRAPKFITPEERRKLEEKRRQDEERLRAQQEDDSKSRALQVMMGGKLEDRAEEEDEEELVAPAWMTTKVESDMSEDERKQVKEFERQIATRREEQEKFRKALEAELRKLQATAKDMSIAFDDKLEEFGEERNKAESKVLKYELGAIKLAQICAYADGGEIRAATILRKLDDLRVEKATVSSEIPEIKRDLERCREDLESALRRDKDIERQFKREFAEFADHMETLLKLFKNRDVVQNDIANAAANSWSPYATLETDAPTDSADSELAPLSVAGLQVQLDQTVLDYIADLRERKYVTECEVKAAQRRFHDASVIVQSILDASDRLRTDVENAEKALTMIAEEAFLAKYDLVHLIELKQGQVEVPSSAVVTDYSDAVLIPRAVIEKHNEAILQVGKTKVDALKEMKDYRKGILMLEWQNSVLDFQAEDLTNRIRDVQLLRVTKQMQEYLRSGDEHKQASEVASIERRAEYSIQNHGHKLSEHRKSMARLQRRIHEKSIENSELDSELERLRERMEETRRIYDAQSDKMAVKADPLKEIYSRRRLVDYARSQAADISILREEVERLRLKTYPSFPAKRP
ncbi:hypothetical protein SmJEL517_g00573 [Synchytrium microbalum]|uniref:Cilia- and flagella-associated protein 43 n=1 Tax=Synchytrium microbalum TaxID=1806994 RepID=A0A507CHS4_9FUNG|nr:uncharacterized protein SmJEL517_g00573 [Synchytrium microbalum]TPX37666.1 hypothetical protein SmJEL517_g00573 [Synchytrium microbalum]